MLIHQVNYRLNINKFAFGQAEVIQKPLFDHFIF